MSAHELIHKLASGNLHNTKKIGLRGGSQGGSSAEMRDDPVPGTCLVCHKIFKWQANSNSHFKEAGAIWHRFCDTSYVRINKLVHFNDKNQMTRSTKVNPLNGQSPARARVLHILFEGLLRAKLSGGAP